MNAPTYSGLYTPDPGDYYYMTILHEVGHAIGLSHPGSYNGGSPTYANDAVYAQDTHQWTVMSYFSASNSGADWNGGSGWQYAQTPMVHDILTVQAIYGADTTTRAGDTIYGFNSNAGNVLFNFSQNATTVLTIYDAGGTDTLDLSGFSQRALIDLEPGTYSSADGTSNTMNYNIGIAHISWIENATCGSGNDYILGNSLDNILRGMGGNDVIFGLLGDDILIGGGGIDLLTGGSDSDTFVFADGDTGATASTWDLITDFESGTDLLDLSGIDSDGSLGILDHFHFLGMGAFNGAGSLHYLYDSSGNVTIIEGDTDGDGTANFAVGLTGNIYLSSADFT